MNPSGLQAAVVLPTLADLGCLPLPCASGAAEASDSIGGAEQKKNSNTYLSTESGEVHVATTGFTAKGLSVKEGCPLGSPFSRGRRDELITKRLGADRSDDDRCGLGNR